MIYSGGFFSHLDKNKLSRLRELKPEQLALTHPVFDDRRLPEMLFRYRARNYPHTLTQEEQARWEAFRRGRLTDKDSAAGGLIIEEYEEKLAQLEAQADITPRDRDIIAQLREWGRELAAYSVFNIK